MKNILFTLIMLFTASFGFSQGIPCTVSNGINSGTVQVTLYASPIGSCQVGCVVSTFCMFPGDVTTVNGCGPDFYEWSYAVVVPTTDDCSVQCSNASAVTVVSPTGCLPSQDFGFHCHAGPYMSDFVGPNTLKIS